MTVALSGDGGDECFGGYSRQYLTARLAPLLNSNRAVRRMAALGVTLLGRGMRKASSTLCPLQRFRRTTTATGQRLADLLGGNDVDEMYRRSSARLSELRLTRAREVAAQGTLPPLGDLLSDLSLEICLAICRAIFS